MDKKSDSQKNKNTNASITSDTAVIDHNNNLNSNQSCIVYKFRSRPPYEGFILILLIVVIAVVLLWWLSTKLKTS